MESALYGIYALVVFVSEILLVRCAHSFDFWHVNNSCINTVRQHFPWSILYIFFRKNFPKPVKKNPKISFHSLPYINECLRDRFNLRHHTNK